MVNFNQEEFISNYKKLKSARKMSKLYGCSKSTILNYAKKIGYTENKNNKIIKISNQNPEEVYSQYLNLKSLKKVGELYSCSDTTIRNFLKKHGYEIQKFENNPNGKLTNVSNEEFISLYNSLKSAKKMANYFNCHENTILNHAKKISYKPKPNNHSKLTQTQKDEIIKEYYTSTSNELAEKYNVSRGMITKIWFDNGLFGKETIVKTTTEKKYC